jgi:hypothetical protein
MQDFERHIDLMFHLVREYCEREGILHEISGLLIFRLIEPDTSRPLAMAVIGEPAPIALMTCHAAIDLLTSDALREHATQHRRVPTA